MGQNFGLLFASELECFDSINSNEYIGICEDRHYKHNPIQQNYLSCWIGSKAKYDVKESVEKPIASTSGSFNSSPSIKAIYCPPADNEIKSKITNHVLAKTLLELSDSYRKAKRNENQDKEERQLHERSRGEERQQHEGSRETENLKKCEKILDWYYQQQDLAAAAQMGKQQKEKTKVLVPHIIGQIKYQTITSKEEYYELHPCEKLYENFSLAENHHSKHFSLFETLSLSDDKDITDEFHIIIVKGKNLSIHDKKFNRCKVKCHVYSGAVKSIHEMNSKNVSFSVKGKAVWHHAFALRGYSSKELQSMYVVLQVVGKSDSKQRIVIGSTVMAGKQAKIWDEILNTSRDPTDSEVIHWEEAVTKPFATIHATAKLTTPIASNTT